MAVSTSIKRSINSCLAPVNLRLETLTGATRRKTQLLALADRGHFDKPAFPLPCPFDSIADELLAEIDQLGQSLAQFSDPSRNDVGFSYDNGWFGSPDAEVLYAIVRRYRPQRVIEVGSGHSTKLIRQALIDNGTASRLISIDPQPRTDMASFTDELYLKRVEDLADSNLFATLESGDVLFIDSSHQIQTGNDVLFLFLQVLPQLPPGVLVHVHDVFLPYEYPREWLIEQGWNWTEQYLLQALLSGSNQFDVIWAGYYLQRTRNDFSDRFPHWSGEDAKSLWMRKAV